MLFRERIASLKMFLRGVLTVLILVLLAMPAGAVRYIDTGDTNNLGIETCFSLDDLERFDIMLNPGGTWVELTFETEQDLVEGMGKLYGCDILKDSRLKYSRRGLGGWDRMFMISANNRQGDGSYRTLLSMLEQSDPRPVYFRTRPVVFPSLESLLRSDALKKLQRDYSPNKLFVEVFDFSSRIYLGLLDLQGRLLLSRADLINQRMNR